MKKKTLILWIALAALVLAAAGFFLHREAVRRAEEEHQRQLDAVVDYTGVMTAEELATLEQYRNLRDVDLRGSDCYEAILAYIAAHPEQKVLYSVPLGGIAAENTETELTLAPEDFTLGELLEGLRWLPALEKISLPRTTLSPEELETLREAFPEGELVWSVMP